MARHLYAEKEVCMNTTLKNAGEIGNRRKESPIMKIKSITFVVAFGLWTPLTLGGSIWGFLVIAGPNSVTRYSNIRLDVISSDNIALLAILTVFLCGGGLWGLGLARLMNADAKSLVKASALTWSATVFAFLMAVVFVGAPIFGGFSRINFLPVFPHYRHYNFLLVFVTSVGIITAINAYVATGKLGFKELRKSVALYTGLAAALGFLAVGLILFFGFGWEVGYPHPGKFGMLLIFLICSIGATLAGGMALGWALDKSRIRLDG
jgi:hypothetical protein